MFNSIFWFLATFVSNLTRYPRLFPVLAALVPALAAAQAPVIAITGADEALAGNIRSHLRIGNEACDSPLTRLERLRPQVMGNVRRAAEALGYYRLTADAVFSTGENCWQLALNVVPGEPIPVNEVSVYLPEDFEDSGVFDETLAAVPALAGKSLNHGDYEAIKDGLSAVAVENGYFSARFNQAEIRLDLAAYGADIVIEFDPGPRYRFGVIRVPPVEGFADDFIANMITLEAGQPYSSEALLEQRNRLDNTQYFRQISISPQLSRAVNQSVPVIIELAPRLQHAWSTGVGFTTDTGPRVRAAYENRYINRLGHRLDGDAAVSGVRSQVNLGYTVPLHDPLKSSLNFRGGFLTESNDTYDSDAFKLESSYRRESSFGWTESYSVDYLRDDYTVDQQADTTTLTMLGYSLYKNVADDLINPSRGWRLFGQVRGASASLLSDTSFVQFYTSGKGVISVGRGRFITRFEAGTTLIDETQELPASVRYFAGGDQSLRGYKYQSLGPRNANGEVIGGKHLLTGSLEYDFPVRENWRTALFYDGGNAFDSDKLEWEHSVGIGLRWLSPIGPIRADLAHPLGADGGVRLHITMGPDL